MSTHTPGPWKVAEHSWCETSIVAAGFDHGICSLDINHASEESQEADAAVMGANACLIAAAPELLEALQTLVDEYEPNLKAFATDAPRKAKWMAALAVIAKATGTAEGRSHQEQAS